MQNRIFNKGKKGQTAAKSKKGFTLIELIIAVAVIALAVTFAFQLYTTGSKAVIRGNTLEGNTQKIVNYFESDSGLFDDEADGNSYTDDAGNTITKSEATATITVTIDGAPYTINGTTETVTIKDESGRTSAQLSKME